MRVPAAKPPIDVEAARDAVLSGKSAAQFARETGFTAKAVSQALRRAGFRLPVRKSRIEGKFDRVLHSLWRSIHHRCSRETSKQFRLYGALGIRVCGEWSTFESFRDWARSTGYSPGMALALRVRRRGYRPANCYWNHPSDVIWDGMVNGEGRAWGITAFGETKSAVAWSKDERCSVGAESIRYRIRIGMPPEDAISKPHLARGSIPGTSARRAAYKARERKRLRTPIDWMQVQKLYVNEQLSIAETALIVGSSYHGVLRGLEKRGWIRPRAKPQLALKHGSLLVKVWSSMRSRCRSPKHPDFAAIGARGIDITPEWDHFPGFYAWAITSGYRKGLVFTRIDRTKNYEPGNCTWTPRDDLIRTYTNRKVSRKPRWTITAFGETKGPTAWSRDPRCTVSESGLVARLKNGAHPEEAITAPNEREGVEFEGSAIEAFGMTKSVAAWSRDRRARVGSSSIAARLKRGIPPEIAITAPRFKVPGVGVDLKRVTANGE